MDDFITASWALITGLWWLWSFLGILTVACLAINGGIVLLIWIDNRFGNKPPPQPRPAMPPALAAHIAEALAADVDAEWRALSDAIGGSA